MGNVYIKPLNEWVSNQNMTGYHIQKMVRSIQKKSKNKITGQQLNKKESDKGIEYHFKWIKDHVIFEKILKQYQERLIEKGILISYKKYDIVDHKFGGKSGLEIIDTYVSDSKEFYIFVKDLYTERVSPPKQIYHITDKKHRDSIKEKGLLLRSSDMGNWSNDLKLNYPPTVFAINDHEYWSSKQSSNEDVWVINTENLNNKWWVDLNFFNIPTHNDEANAYMTFENIPPQNIHLLYNKPINERKNYGELYHFTTLILLTLIIMENKLYGDYLEWESERRRVKWPKKYKFFISFTRDKNFIKKTEEFIKSGGRTGIVVDGETISDKFKLRPFNFFYHTNTKSKLMKRDESEESLLIKKDYIDNIKSYMKSLIIPSLDNFAKETDHYYFEGLNLWDNIEAVNKLFNTKFNVGRIIDEPEQMELLYNTLLNYIKESKIPYEIY